MLGKGTDNSGNSQSSGLCLYHVTWELPKGERCSYLCKSQCHGSQGRGQIVVSGLGWGCVLEEGPGDPSMKEARWSLAQQSPGHPSGLCNHSDSRWLEFLSHKGDLISRQRSYSLGEPPGEVGCAEVGSIRVSLWLAPLEMPGPSARIPGGALPHLPELSPRLRSRPPRAS